MIEDRALTPEELQRALESMVEDVSTYGVFVDGKLWCVCPGNGIDRAKVIARGVEQFG